jgi:Flp pilus assembly protein TadG
VTGRRPGRGSVSVELAILAPAFLALVVLAAIVGRVAVAHNAVTVAAHDAARAASISRDAGTAATRAEAAARTALADQGLACAELVVDPDTTQFARPAGEPAVVSVTIACRVAVTDLAPVPMVEGRWVSATFVSPLDTWRGRS